LRSADFAKADLVKSNLSDALCSNAIFIEANLEGANLSDADLSGADLRGARLEWADLFRANLSEARLERANLQEARMFGANLCSADLSLANLASSALSKANLTGANLQEADLRLSQLVEANLTQAKINGCRVYGISAWGLILNGTEQNDLIITPQVEPLVTVDDLEVAQFVYLILHNPNIRKVIDTIGRRGVLILGRFTPERKAVLDAIRNELRRLGYVPMLFDFERPSDRNFTETIVTLAGMSLFVIVDVTNPSSSPLELQATVPIYNIPFAPILLKGEKPFSMFDDLRRRYKDQMLNLLTYSSPAVLVKALEKAIVIPALERSRILSEQKLAALQTHDADDYL
jgi:hypothetical protein